MKSNFVTPMGRVMSYSQLAPTDTAESTESWVVLRMTWSMGDWSRWLITLGGEGLENRELFPSELLPRELPPKELPGLAMPGLWSGVRPIPCGVDDRPFLLGVDGDNSCDDVIGGEAFILVPEVTGEAELVPSDVDDFASANKQDNFNTARHFLFKCL